MVSPTNNQILKDAGAVLASAETRFLAQARRSRIFALSWFLFPAVLLIVFACLAAGSVGTAEKTSRLASLGRAALENTNRTLNSRIVELQENIVFLEAQGRDDTGPDRCHLRRPADSAFVFFGFGNTDITPSIESFLDSYLLRLGRDKAPAELLAIGFADRRGSTGANQRVSADRAGAVAAYLKRRREDSGITIDAVGRGDECPTVSGAENADRRDPCQRMVMVLPRSEVEAPRRFCPARLH